MNDIHHVRSERLDIILFNHIGKFGFNTHFCDTACCFLNSEHNGNSMTATIITAQRQRSCRLYRIKVFEKFIQTLFIKQDFIMVGSIKNLIMIRTQHAKCVHHKRNFGEEQRVSDKKQFNDFISQCEPNQTNKHQAIISVVT